MRICFVNTPYGDVYKLAKAAVGRTPPTTQAYLAAYMRDRGYEVCILDAHNEGIKVDEISDHFSGDIDVVAVSSLTPSYRNSLKVLGAVKRIKPSCITVMGGQHITALPEQVMLEAKDLDFGILGEGEETFAELLDVLTSDNVGPEQLNKVNGIVFRDGQRPVVTSKRDFISDLDRLPLPAYDLLDIDAYELKPHHTWANTRISLKPYMNIFTSRGCPYSCTFCASNLIWGRGTRFKSPDYVLNEIDTLVNVFGIRSIFICDDTFLTKKDRVVEILKRIIEKKYDLNFCCMGRVDEVDEEVLVLLKQANCHLIRFGVESCSQPILDAMKKGYSIKQVKRAFKLCKETGIAASASIIIGYPGETRSTFSETLKNIIEIDPVGCEFFIALPIVGTEFYKLAHEKKYIIERDWEEWTLLPEEPLIGTEHLKPSDLIDLRREAYLTFYLRPSKILQILRQIKDVNDIKYYLKGLFAMVGLVRTSHGKV